MEKKPVLIIIRGIPGSGKSTFVTQKLMPEYKKLGLSVGHFEADMFLMKDGKYDWSPEKACAAHKKCQESVEKSLSENDVTIVSNTFVRVSDMRPYIKMAEAVGADIDVYRSQGNFGSVHNVPDETIKRMKDALDKSPYPGEIPFNVQVHDNEGTGR